MEHHPFMQEDIRFLKEIFPHLCSLFESPTQSFRYCGK
jgi:hypothetical protein